MKHNIVLHSFQLLVLPDGVEWPKKPTICKGPYPSCTNPDNPTDCTCQEASEQYERELAAALSQCVPIVEENQGEVMEFICQQVCGKNQGDCLTKDCHSQFDCRMIQDGTIYSVELSLEKVEQFRYSAIKGYAEASEWMPRKMKSPMVGSLDYRTAYRLKDVKQEKDLHEVLREVESYMNPKPDKELISVETLDNEDLDLLISFHEAEIKKHQERLEQLKLIQHGQNIG